MVKKKIIAVSPVFSLLDSRLQGLITDEVLVYKDAIEEALKKYDVVPIGSRNISIDKLHTRLSGKTATQPLSLKKAIYVYWGKEQITKPFLLGLVTEQSFLGKIQDIQSIEIFEEEQLFVDRFGRKSQLCLRRRGSGWVVDISTYVYKGLINAGERESSSSINTLSFVEESVEEGPVEQQKDLSKKIIK